MSYRTAKRQAINTSKRGLFSWWYVDNIDNFNMASYYSSYLRNCRLDGQWIVIRPWHSLFARLTAWVYPKGIGSYLRTVATNDVLVVRHNQDTTHKLVTITTEWVITAIDTSTKISSDTRMNFVNVWDVIYCMNGSDRLWKLTATTYAYASSWTIGNVIAPTFGVIFNSCMWVSWYGAYPNRVYKSVWDTYADFDSPWTDYFDFSEPMTWLATVSEALFYFTKNTIAVTNTSDVTDTAWTFTYSNRNLQVKEWATNHQCIIGVGNEIYYVTSSNTINKIARGNNVYGFETLDVSHRPYTWISKIMDSLDPDQSTARGYFLPAENLIKRHFKSLWSAINDIVVIYDLTKDAFLIDSSKYFYDGIEFKGKNYTVSMVEWKVFQDEYWQDDEDAPIPFEYRTKEFYLSDPTFKKILRETRTLIDINELASLRQEIWIDWGKIDTKVIDWNSVPWEITWWIGIAAMWEFAMGTDWLSNNVRDNDYVEMDILRTKWNLNKICKKVQFRFINWTLASKVRLKNITTKFEVKDPITTNLTE